jgi:hypothetical protein
MIDWGGARVDSTHECCGYHVCSCKRQFERTQSLGHCDSMSLQTAFGELKVIADPRMSQNSPPMFIPRTLAGLFCAACGALPPVGASLSGAFCTKCIDKADAEAKPVSDAMDAKIKALMGLMPYASYELLAAALDEDKT